MIVVSKLGNYTYCINLNVVPQITVNKERISNSYLNKTIITEDNSDLAIERFNDIAEAIADGQKIYDARKEVGYWKPKEKPKATTKAHTTRKAKAPASGEHQEPAEKK